MLAEQINFTDIIDKSYEKIVDLGKKYLSRRNTGRETIQVSCQINAIMEGIGYLESSDNPESDKLKVAQRLIEIGEIREYASAVYKGDVNTSAESTV